jgi:hypothetical protein
MNKMDGKIKFLSNFFKLGVLKKKGLFQKRRQNGGLNHVLSTVFPQRRGLSYLGIKFPKFRGQMLSKSNIFYTIENILKVRYCI